ncbi:hypothetical protein MHBO_000694 [Bonamia ostreae]|uniref:Uncharacterized protein n=1 Tax=Bonamia ostreae TaxID=126728 RepID=A0ABV2AHB8_9EUKA
MSIDEEIDLISNDLKDEQDRVDQILEKICPADLRVLCQDSKLRSLEESVIDLKRSFSESKMDKAIEQIEEINFRLEKIGRKNKAMDAQKRFLSEQAATIERDIEKLNLALRKKQQIYQKAEKRKIEFQQCEKQLYFLSKLESKEDLEKFLKQTKKKGHRRNKKAIERIGTERKGKRGEKFGEKEKICFSPKRD